MAFPSPSLTPPALTNWQFAYGGVTFGAATALGVLKVQGLGDVATIRTGDIARPRQHGELIGLDVYGGRDITVDMWAQSDGVSLQHALLSLAGPTVDGLTTEQPLWFQQPNLPLLAAMCRPRKRTVPWDSDFGAANVAKPVVRWHATDPRLYTAGQTVTVGLPTPTAGMTFPAVFPITFGSSTPNGVTVTNTGNTEMFPLLVITGPVTNPTVQNASIPGTPAITLSNPAQSGFTVLAGDQVVVDLDLQTVQYYAGGVAAGSPADRSSWIVPGSTWWDLPPGPNLIQFLSADSSSVGGTCQVQWASAYML
jgi:hypothetical protein